MTNKQKEEVWDIIESEGFGYAFISYSSFDWIDDKTFHRLREDFCNAAQVLKDYIGPQP